MNGGLAIGRIAGIEIRLSLVWAGLVAVVTLVGLEQAVLSSPELPAPAQWLIGALVALAFLATVIAHEMAHALVGRRYGVETTSVMIGFVGGLAPLSVQASRPVDELVIALAGPALSITVAFLSGLIALAVGVGGPGLTAVAGGFLVVGVLNFVLGIVSLLPGLPLDGGRVVRALAWAWTRDLDRAGRITVRVGRLLGWTGVGSGLALTFLDRVSGGLLVLALGWLLATGSRTLDRRLNLEILLRGMTVGEATRRDSPRLTPNLTVDTFAGRFEGEEGSTSLPVLDDDTVLGVIGVRRVRRLGRKRFATTRAAEVMVTPPRAPLLSAGDDLWTAVDLMNGRDLDGLAVVADGRLEGMVTRQSIGQVIASRTRGGSTDTSETA